MKMLEIVSDKEKKILEEMAEAIKNLNFVTEKTVIVCISKSMCGLHAAVLSHMISFDGIPVTVTYKEIPDTSSKKVQSLNIAGLFTTMYNFDRYIFLYPGHLHTNNAYNAVSRVKEFFQKHSMLARNVIFTTVLENEEWNIKANVAGRSFNFSLHGKPFFWWENRRNPYRFSEEDIFNQ